MTKEEMLRMMRLLSALESYGMARQERLADYLMESLAEMVEILEREILK